MRVVKSVSLPVDLAKKAEEFENFSVFVADAIKHGVEENIQHQYARCDAYKRRALTYKAIVHELVGVIKKHGNKTINSYAADILYDTTEGVEILERS